MGCINFPFWCSYLIFPAFPLYFSPNCTKIILQKQTLLPKTLYSTTFHNFPPALCQNRRVHSMKTAMDHEMQKPCGELVCLRELLNFNQMKQINWALSEFLVCPWTHVAGLQTAMARVVKMIRVIWVKIREGNRGPLVWKPLLFFYLWHN